MAGLLADYGVTAVFGVPGGQTLPLYYGILDEGNRIRHILMKDEIDATFAADAYARISGGIGVCDATAGCGAIKFISGLAEAYNTSIPVIAIGSEMEGDWLAARYRGTGSQVVDSKEVLKPVTGVPAPCEQNAGVGADCRPDGGQWPSRTRIYRVSMAALPGGIYRAGL